MQKTWLFWAGLFPFHCGKCKKDFYLTVRHLQSSNEIKDQFFNTLPKD